MRYNCWGWLSRRCRRGVLNCSSWGANNPRAQVSGCGWFLECVSSVYNVLQPFAAFFFFQISCCNSVTTQRNAGSVGRVSCWCCFSMAGSWPALSDGSERCCWVTAAVLRDTCLTAVMRVVAWTGNETFLVLIVSAIAALGSSLRRS